jgi:hypothetical protein
MYTRLKYGSDGRYTTAHNLATTSHTHLPRRESELTMTQRTKQVALTIALGLPLVITLLVAGPFSASTGAQGAQRMLGPRFPPLIDSTGRGFPTPGIDPPVNPQLSGTTLNFTTLFSCATSNNNRVGLVAQDPSGKYRGAVRSLGARDQSMAITGFTGGAPTQFTYTELDPRGIRAMGVGQLVDLNGDGKMDTVIVSGNINTTLNLVFTADGHYVSIPVSQAAALGATQGRCGPAVGQVWVPLVDTLGDGRGDTIILDLDGDGVADPQFYSSPRLGAAGVPTTSNLALSILTALLGGIGVWYIGHRRQSTPGPMVQG